MADQSPSLGIVVSMEQNAPLPPRMDQAPSLAWRIKFCQIQGGDFNFRVPYLPSVRERLEIKLSSQVILGYP